MTHANTTKKLVPQLRFPEFSGEYSKHTFSDLVKKKSNSFNSSNSSENYKCIELESLSQVTGQLLNVFESKDLKSNKTKFKKGEVLYGKLRPYLKKFLLAEFDGVCSTEIWVFEGKKTIGSYLFYLIQTNKFDYEANKTSGSKMPRADWNYVSNVTYSIPAVSEQQKIANFLSLVDKKISLLQQQHTALETYKKGLLQQLFSQQIRFKDNNGNNFPDWEEKRLGEICTFFSGGTPKSSNKEYYKGEIPFIGSGNISDESVKQFINQKAIENSSAKIVQKGDLLYALYGATSGEVAISKMKGAINQAVLCIRTREKKEFLYYYFFHNKKSIISKFLQGGQGNLSATILKKLKIPMPCLEEQTKIADFLSKVDERIAIVHQQISKTQQFKKGLLQQLFV